MQKAMQSLWFLPLACSGKSVGSWYVVWALELSS